MLVLSTSRSAYESATLCTIMSHTEVSRFSSATLQLLKPSSTLQEKPVLLPSHEPDWEIRSDDFHGRRNHAGRKLL